MTHPIKRIVPIAEVLRVIREVSRQPVYHVVVVEWPDCTEYQPRTH